MDKLTPFLKTFGLVIIAALALLVAFFVIGVEKRCTFEIRNDSKSTLNVETFKYDSDHRKVIVDTVALAIGETLEIGRCVNCLAADSTHLDFDAIALFDSTDSTRTYQFLRRGVLLKYLESKEKEGCGTWVIR